MSHRGYNGRILNLVGSITGDKKLFVLSQQGDNFCFWGEERLTGELTELLETAEEREYSYYQWYHQPLTGIQVENKNN